MSNLILFGDESGTMPKTKNDGPFVTSFVSYVGDNIERCQIDFHRKDFIQSLAKNDILPMITFVRPGENYFHVLKNKMTKINLMARMTRLITGNNADYLTNIGFPTANFIWIFAMSEAISLSIYKNITIHKIDEIKIFLDQKTLAGPTRKFFLSNIYKIPTLMKNTLLKFYDVNPKYIENAFSNINFSNESISIHWSNELNKDQFKNGFLTAHHLAKYSFTSIRRWGIEFLEKKLRNAGFNNSMRDVTALLTAPINDKAIEVWKKNTGLPEPNI